MKTVLANGNGGQIEMPFAVSSYDRIEISGDLNETHEYHLLLIKGEGWQGEFIKKEAFWPEWPEWLKWPQSWPWEGWW